MNNFVIGLVVITMIFLILFYLWKTRDTSNIYYDGYCVNKYESCIDVGHSEQYCSMHKTICESAYCDGYCMMQNLLCKESKNSEQQCSLEEIKCRKNCKESAK